MSESIKNAEDEALRTIAPATWQKLDTPCLLIDGQIVQHNITRLADYCQQHSLILRPHTKTHKSLRIAQLQIGSGAEGLTVAKPGEARSMAALGAELLVAYPAVTPNSLRTIRDLSGNGRILVAIDTFESLDKLDAALSGSSCSVGVLVDIDVGLHRTGVQHPNESLALAQQAEQSHHLELEGIFCYPGHIWELPQDQQTPLSRVESVLADHIGQWREAGLAAKIVSGGSTPTAYQTHLAPSITEIRPGTYVFNDVNTWRGGYCKLSDCAARILTTVVSTAVPGQVVIDAGNKTLARDPCHPAPESGFGYVVEFPEARITQLSEEHGQVDVSKCAWRPRVGDRVTVIPNHVCPTVNLTDAAWWVTADGACELLPIDTRGMVQ